MFDILCLLVVILFGILLVIGIISNLYAISDFSSVDDWSDWDPVNYSLNQQREEFFKRARKIDRKY
jgi:hypothetical protein